MCVTTQFLYSRACTNSISRFLEWLISQQVFTPCPYNLRFRWGLTAFTLIWAKKLGFDLVFTVVHFVVACPALSPYFFEHHHTSLPSIPLSFFCDSKSWSCHTMWLYVEIVGFKSHRLTIPPLHHFLLSSHFPAWAFPSFLLGVDSLALFHLVILETFLSSVQYAAGWALDILSQVVLPTLRPVHCSRTVQNLVFLYGWWAWCNPFPWNDQRCCKTCT